MAYIAFLSYSHEADAKLAPALQRALHGFAKPWYRLRALRIFRDKTSLAASAALGPSIEKALSESEYFLLLASEPAAKSKWVRQEIEWWLNHRSVDKMLALLTSGEILWDGRARDFDWGKTTAIHRELAGKFTDEPLYVDLRWAKNPDDLSLRSTDFRSAVLDIAAPLHGRPKDELDGEDVREHRKTRRLAWIVGWTLAGLLVAAAAAAWFAFEQWGNARHRLAELYEEQGRQELLKGRHEQALAYLNEAFSHGADRTSLRYLIAQAARPLGVPRVSLDDRHGSIREAAFSRDHRLVVTVGEKGTADVWDAKTGSLWFSAGGDDAEGIEAATFTPDAAQILTVSRNGKASLRRIDDPKVQLALGDPKGGVRAARLSPSGKRALTEGPDARLEVWDADTGKHVVSLQGQAADVDSASFSPDSGEVAGAAGGQVLVWDAESGALRRAFTGPSDRVKSLVFSGDGSRILTVTERGAAQVWDGASGREVATLGGVRGSIAVQAQISGDGTRLLARTESGSLLLRDAEHGPSTVSKSEHGWILAAVMSPDGKRVALGTDSGWAGVVDAATGETVASLVGHTLRVRALAFSADGGRVLTGSADRTAAIWEADGGKPVATLAGHRDDITVVAFNADGTEALTAGADGTASLWVVPAADPLTASKAGTQEIGAVAFSPNGKQLLSAGYDKAARLWDAGTARVVSELKGHDQIVVAAAFTDDGGRVITGSYDNTVRIWDAKTGKEVAKLTGHDNAVRGLATDKDRLISAGADATVRIWDGASPAALSVFRIPGERREGIALSRGGRLVAMPDGEGAMNVWRVANGKLAGALVGDKESLRYAVFSPDGGRILLIRENNVVRHYRTAKIWDIARRRPLVSLEEGVNVMEVASFSADGRRVVSGHSDGAIRVWDTETGRLLALLSASGSPVSAAGFSPESAERVVVGRRDGTLQVWDARLDTRTPEQIAAFVEQRVRFQLHGGRLLPIAAAALPPKQTRGPSR